MRTCLIPTEISQSDEDELIAVSFAGLYDLERGRPTRFLRRAGLTCDAVHAPNGIFQQFAATAERQPTQSDRDCRYESMLGLVFVHESER
jgi:hypothetical protein